MGRTRSQRALPKGRGLATKWRTWSTYYGLDKRQARRLRRKVYRTEKEPPCREGGCDRVLHLGIHYGTIPGTERRGPWLA